MTPACFEGSAFVSLPRYECSSNTFTTVNLEHKETEISSLKRSRKKSTSKDRDAQFLSCFSYGRLFESFIVLQLTDLTLRELRLRQCDPHHPAVPAFGPVVGVASAPCQSSPWRGYKLQKSAYWTRSDKKITYITPNQTKEHRYATDAFGTKHVVTAYPTKHCVNYNIRT